MARLLECGMAVQDDSLTGADGCSSGGSADSMAELSADKMEAEWVPGCEQPNSDGASDEERTEEAHAASQAAIADELAGIEEGLALKERLLQQMLAGEEKLATLKATNDEHRMQAALAGMQEQASFPLKTLT